MTQSTAFKLSDIRTGGVMDRKEIELGKEKDSSACTWLEEHEVKVEGIL